MRGSGGGISISCADADLICESFEGSNGPNNEYDLSSWTEVNLGDGTIDAGSSHLGSLSCADKGNDAYRIIWGTTPQDDIYSRVDIGSSQSGIVWISFYFYLNSESIPTYGSAIPMIQLMESVTTVSGVVQLIDRTSPDFALRMGWWNGSVWTYSSATAVGTIQLQTWHKIDLLYNNSTNQVAIWIDGTQEMTGGDANITRNVRYIELGSYDSNYIADYQLDNFKIDNDTRPGVCQ